MKSLKRIAAAALAAALAASLGVAGASATTLEVKGITQAGSVAIAMSMKPGTSLSLKDTFGFSGNTCTESNTNGTTNVFTGASVTAPISSLTFKKCTNEPVAAHKGGTLHITHIAGTTNGTVTSSGAEITMNSPFGTLTCITGAGTHIGTLTGATSASGHAELHFNVQFPCSGISSKWTGTYTVTSPTGLGVVA